jgi:hypothetical protein
MNPNELPLKTVMSLCAMLRNMEGKKLELKRLAKTAALLLLGGVSPNSIPPGISERCLQEQHPDGGWVATVDTMWNALFLETLDKTAFRPAVEKALRFITAQKNQQGLWGRSKRDMSRIPVTGILFYLFPRLADNRSLLLLEKLWLSEKNSLTYKAGYTLMAFNRCGYRPQDQQLVPDAVHWLLENQETGGGFSPWREHPVEPDVYCTSIALLGLDSQRALVPPQALKRGLHWLLKNRLDTGLWKYHEIEDGASWGLYTITQLLQNHG